MIFVSCVAWLAGVEVVPLIRIAPFVACTPGSINSPPAISNRHTTIRHYHGLTVYIVLSLFHGPFTAMRIPSRVGSGVYHLIQAGPAIKRAAWYDRKFKEVVSREPLRIRT